MPKVILGSPHPKSNSSAPARRRPDPPCVDLDARFGRRYRIEYEESYSAQHGPKAKVRDPWLMVIPCRAGHISPWGGSLLAACTNTSGPTARKLAALPGAEVAQDGGDGVTVLFDVGQLKAVAKLMHPRRCRQLSHEQRARLADAGSKYRFRDGAGARGAARPCVQRGLFDLGAAQDETAVLEPCGVSL